MSIVFILILISVLSSYIMMINDQIAYAYDIVVQLEKNVKSFYEMEFVIYYVLGYFRKHYKEISLPHSENFELYFSPERKKLSFSVMFVRAAEDIKASIIINRSGIQLGSINVSCFFTQGADHLIKLKNYRIKKSDYRHKF